MLFASYDLNLKHCLREQNPIVSPGPTMIFPILFDAQYCDTKLRNEINILDFIKVV